jgi:hypothetical protein
MEKNKKKAALAGGLYNCQTLLSYFIGQLRTSEYTSIL